MACLLNKLTDRILFGDTAKKIDKYFRTATPDSVLQDLYNSYLVQKQPTAYRAQIIFEASCVRASPPLKPYWTKECLQSHIAKVHPDTTFPEPAIDVLWSCFYFYAYYPFPRENCNGGKLELSAFQRALTLLALRGTSLLGSVDEFGYGGVYWRDHDSPGVCVPNINRIFRSIGKVSHKVNKASEIVAPSTFIIDDAMDVLATTHPYHVKFHPYDSQLRGVAERLLEGRIPQYQVKSDDLVTLVSLVLRLRVHKPTWGEEGGDFRYGSFDNSSPQNDELAEALVQAFRAGPQGLLAPDCMLLAIYILPNLEPSFHQMWAAIFQPHKPADIPAIGAELSPDSSMDNILRAVSLLIPPYEAPRRVWAGREIDPVTFDASYHSPNQESLNSLSVKHIIQHITNDEHLQASHLVLILGTRSHIMAPVVVGAFFPKTASSTITEDEKRDTPGELKLPHPDVLFQLQPTFTVLRRSGQNTSISDEARVADVDSPAHPYWIGSTLQSNGGLKIDPVTREGIFMRPTIGAPDQDTGLFEETASGNENDDDVDRSTKFTVTDLVIFRVNGGPKQKYWQTQ
ncbi:hypothetical protein BO94DRAFT_496071 [Aspergillus sclerotioniger CBS 115572]|uniref:Uncharacterized protein n=1 Tax=Aspergillus sclerotioniger CBS 115572 TaxID=1450535 RepID=A0A317W9Q6_9EURO|nr:hypothetical protein BO94DRAFT_496071 [Aspergillus sclerotioniger CBS 115572]PWY81708.1 hypothetical protein BO94DRAFT_496071 [Aspergillus sclerotioniger CBS 115572]